jgi:hypothetical protein
MSGHFERDMKRFLRHRKSRKWVSKRGTPIPHARGARHFGTLHDLVKFCADRKLQEMEVVLRFGQRKRESTFPLADI